MKINLSKKVMESIRSLNESVRFYRDIGTEEPESRDGRFNKEVRLAVKIIHHLQDVAYAKAGIGSTERGLMSNNRDVYFEEYGTDEGSTEELDSLLLLGKPLRFWNESENKLSSNDEVATKWWRESWDEIRSNYPGVRVEAFQDDRMADVRVYMPVKPINTDSVSPEDLKSLPLGVLEDLIESSKYLNVLKDHKNHRVRMQVASVTREYDDQFVNDPNEYVRYRVAWNSTNPDLLRILEKDSEVSDQLERNEFYVKTLSRESSI